MNLDYFPRFQLFREMVLADLSGIQQTLDLYAIQHDTFDFESELGWDVRLFVQVVIGPFPV